MAAHWLRSQNILNAIDHQVKLSEVAAVNGDYLSRVLRQAQQVSLLLPFFSTVVIGGQDDDRETCGRLLFLRFRGRLAQDRKRGGPGFHHRGPLVEVHCLKKCRSNHTCVEFKLAGGCTSVGSGGSFRGDGGGSVACNCSRERVQIGTTLPSTGAPMAR